MNGKKILVLLLVVFLAFGITGCKKKNKKENKDEDFVNFSVKVKSVYDTNKGTIVTGSLDEGQINLYDEVVIKDGNKKIYSTIISIETEDGIVKSADEGSSVSLLLKNVSADDVEEGQTITKSISNKVKINTSYDSNGPLIVGIDAIYVVDETSCAVIGKIYRGIINEHEPIQVVGLDSETINVPVQSLAVNYELVETAQAGDIVSIFLKDIDVNSIKIGQTVVDLESIAVSKEFDADVMVLNEEKSGNKSPLKTNTKYDISILSADINGTVIIEDDEEEISVGDSSSVNIKLDNSAAVEIGMEFVIKDNGIIIAKGEITKIYE